MKTILFSDLDFVPASHENPSSPGSLKKVIFAKDDLQAGRIQMVNWSSIGVSKQFAKHYHEDMQEFFVMMQGTAEITVGANTAVLRRGDTVLIDPREVHHMRNIGAEEVTYLAVGITNSVGGKTVVVGE